MTQAASVNRRTRMSGIDLILEGTAGVYRRVNLSSVPGTDFNLVPFGSDLSASGFAPLGDLMCSAYPEFFVRGFAHGSRELYALLLSAFIEGEVRPVALDFYTRCEGGASLTTTSLVKASDKKGRGIYRRAYGPKPVFELYEKHREHLREFAREHGPAVPHEPTLLALAESLDEFLVRELRSAPI